MQRFSRHSPELQGVLTKGSFQLRDSRLEIGFARPNDLGAKLADAVIKTTKWHTVGCFRASAGAIGRFV